MRLLILGGTRFLGRAVAEEALARGHRVTLFNRGKSDPSLFPECERLVGDRDGGLGVLDGRDWDAVVDPSGFVPRLVSEAARRLAGRIEHYSFVSSISVYAEPVPAGADESAPVARLDDPATEVVDGARYGGLKALCERAAEEALPGRVLVVRAGLLVGPHDTTNRFPYWVKRLARGGEVLVPDALDQAVQLVDARDVAAWMVRMAESRGTGTFNVTGPAEPITLGGTLDRIRAVTGAESHAVPVAERFLTEREVVPWMELPLWAPGAGGLLSVSARRALERGLAFRPLDATIRDTLEWCRTGGQRPPILPPGLPGSLSPEREVELLAAWRSAAR